MPLGVLVAGPVSEALGIHTTLVGMSVIGAATALACLAAPAVRTLPRGDVRDRAAPAPAAP
jgi:hypothetical protein